MHSRDLFFGSLFVIGSAWIAVGTAAGTGDPAFLAAVVGCGIAGVVYLLAGAGVGVGTPVVGRPLTRGRLRAVAQALIALSMIVLGIAGYAATGDVTSGMIAAIGVVVLALAAARWRRGAPETSQPSRL